MKAGRDLDALVATDVMGWHMHGDTWAFWRNSDGHHMAPAGSTDDEWWSPSTELPGAMEVLETFDRWLLKKMQMNDGRVVYQVEVMHGGRYVIGEQCDTLPLAVCHTALLVRETS